MSLEPASCPGCENERIQVFDVEGLDCAAEATLIEGHLRSLPGVCSVRALPLQGQARVVHTLEVGDIERALGALGFPARERHGSQVRRPGARITIAAAILLLAGFVAGFASRQASIALYLPAVVLAGAPIVRLALRRLRSGLFDMNVLMSLAVFGAMALGEWGEATTTVVLFSAAQWLEGQSLVRARRALSHLEDLAPDQACVVRPEGEQRIPPAQIAPGEIVIVRPGERIPLDGTVVKGISEADESMLTGESRPVAKGPGDAVFAGSLNGSGAIEARTTRRADDTTLARIVRRVEEAQASRAPLQGIVDRFAAVYTPAVTAAAVVLASVPPLLGADFESWLYRALVLLVVACPCALVISTPVSIASALTAATRRGILVKGGAYLEALARVRAVVLDKTGTLTEGRPRVVELAVSEGVSRADLLRVAASLDVRSAHALSRAVVDAARAQGVPIEPAEHVASLPGLGLRGRLGPSELLVGNARLMQASGVSLAPGLEAWQIDQQRLGRSVVQVADVGLGRVLGLIAIEDAPRPEARGVVEALEAQDIRVIMLSGDDEATTAALAGRLGITHFEARLLPEQKLARIRGIEADLGATVMVGDGVNDAPALAAATVGVAMGREGADAAVETADVALLREDLRGLPELMALGRRTRRTIAWNLGLSLTVKALVLVLAVAGHGSLWAAIGADMGASLLVIGNGMRLLQPSQ